MVHQPEQSASHALFQGLKDLGPEIVSLTKNVGQAHVCHAGVGPTREAFELADEVLEAEGFTGGLCGGGFEHYVHDVDVEVVECGLVMQVQLYLVSFNLRVFGYGCFENFVSHVFQPCDVALLEIPQAPDVPPLNDG